METGGLGEAAEVTVAGDEGNTGATRESLRRALRLFAGSFARNAPASIGGQPNLGLGPPAHEIRACGSSGLVSELPFLPAHRRSGHGRMRTTDERRV
jgi:hypothetical protein